MALDNRKFVDSIEGSGAAMTAVLQFGDTAQLWDLYFKDSDVREVLEQSFGPARRREPRVQTKEESDERILRPKQPAGTSAKNNILSWQERMSAEVVQDEYSSYDLLHGWKLLALFWKEVSSKKKGRELRNPFVPTNYQAEGARMCRNFVAVEKPMGAGEVECIYQPAMGIDRFEAMPIIRESVNTNVPDIPSHMDFLASTTATEDESDSAGDPCALAKRQQDWDKLQSPLDRDPRDLYEFEEELDGTGWDLCRRDRDDYECWESARVMKVHASRLGWTLCTQLLTRAIRQLCL
ncbi:hypothetical protein CNMCM5793_004197 [Aspergillus hiratsukae]|uniref:Uncharacterized protein n=1 Tax=Aspergillus hiratsukae TaxID=1194566 RepID=A0A8H6PFI4_9EURO|nr:hypothetical protein CNMCM5793_004197 [Aspergillus hiratsukae]KAF7169473.1 hypothetical protein CNMCM6106_004358 [Aspergillus hiratsukae]